MRVQAPDPAGSRSTDRARHLRGLLLTTAGVLVLTPDTLLLRLLPLDLWTIAFWRGALLGLSLTIFLIGRQKSRVVLTFVAIGRIGVLIAVLYATESILFVVAVTHTSIAQTLVIVAAAPLVSAVLGTVILGERTPRETWLAIAFALAGVSIVFWDGLGRGTWRGDLAALGTAIGLGAMFTAMHHARAVNMVPATALGGFLSALLVFPLASPLAISASDSIVLGAIGLFVLPISFGLITVGPRYLPGAEVGLILLLETILGPFWVWLALGEGVSAETMVGGTVVIATLAVHSWVRLRSEPAATAA